MGNQNYITIKTVIMTTVPIRMMTILVMRMRMHTITTAPMETTPTTLCRTITGAIDALQCLATFIFFLSKIFFPYDVLSRDPFCPHVPIGFNIYLSVLQENFLLFCFSIAYCHISYT